MVNDKTIENHFCVCAISLEINYWNAHCFTPVVFSAQTGVVLHKRIVVSADSKVYGRRKKWGSTFYVGSLGTKKGRSLIDLFSLNIWGKRGGGCLNSISSQRIETVQRRGSSKTAELTETKRSSYWQPSRHWLHPRLSFGQPQVQPVTKRLSIWRPFCFQYLPN